jgi:hypothetical protein
MKRLLIAIVAAMALAIPQNADASVTFNGHTYTNSQVVNCTSSSACNWSYLTGSITGSNTAPMNALAFSSVSGTCSLVYHSAAGYDAAATTFASSTGSSEFWSQQNISSGSSFGWTITGCNVTVTVYFS